MSSIQNVNNGTVYVILASYFSGSDFKIHRGVANKLAHAALQFFLSNEQMQCQHAMPETNQSYLFDLKI
jgi:hypothetical protein